MFSKNVHLKLKAGVFKFLRIGQNFEKAPLFYGRIREAAISNFSSAMWICWGLKVVFDLNCKKSHSNKIKINMKKQNKTNIQEQNGNSFVNTWGPRARACDSLVMRSRSCHLKIIFKVICPRRTLFKFNVPDKL